MSNITPYNPDKVELNFGGMFAFSGFAEGTAIEAQRNNPRTNNVVGMKGDVATTLNADKTGTLTVTLLQNSPTNQYLSALVAAEDRSGKLTRANLTLKEPSGGVIADFKRCHLTEPAPVTLGDGQNAKVWTFFVEEMVYLEVPSGIFEGVAGVTDAVAALETISDNLFSDALKGGGLI